MKHNGSSMPLIWSVDNGFGGIDNKNEYIMSNVVFNGKGEI